MLTSRADFLKGLVAGAALLPVAANAKPSSDVFHASLAGNGPKPWTAAPDSGQSPLRFAVIGDNTGLARPGVFDRAMEQIAWLQPDFILSVGDLIEGYTEDKAEIVRQWSAIETSVAKAGLPFVFTCGNHDVDNAETLEAWQQRRGAGYYSFTYKGALFIVLNTEDTPRPMTAAAAQQFYGIIGLMKSDPVKAQKIITDYMTANGSRNDYANLEAASFGDRQLGFVRDTLAKYRNVRWTFVVLHKPAWKLKNAEFTQIQNLLKGRPYTVFAGHTHYFTHEVIEGADYINMATTGGIIHQVGPGTLDHTMMVTLSANGPIYANQRLTGLLDRDGQSGQTYAY